MIKTITANTKVIQKKNLPTVELDGEIALMNTDKGNYYSLDPIGSRIWVLMSEQITIAALVSILLNEYEISKEVCEQDVIELITQLNDQSLIDIEF